jgi:lipopolysaccharide transport system ATP-binding protein
MSSDVTPRDAIVTQGLSKLYQLGERQPYRRLGEAIVRAIKRPFRGEAKHKDRGDLWALNDVSFTVHEGEIVGVVGANGAGKTTLLRILAKITLPTKGRAEIHGRVGSLLEVGTGFHPELTGRENVFLNGSILGMSRREIAAKYDEIVEFAQILEFMETPVKHYSTGMRVRLAFSVAAHLEPEILFIDEVLSVGDAEFQAKCLGKMEEVANAGRTILFVSHNMGAVTRLCTRCLWVDHGKIRMDGDAQEVVEAYLSRGGIGSGRWVHPEDPECGADVQIRSIEVLSSDGRPDADIPFEQPIRIRIEHEVRKPVRGYWIRAHIHDMGGTLVITTANTDADATPGSMGEEPGVYSHTFEIPGGLLRPARYMISAKAKVKHGVLDDHENALQFDVLPIGKVRGRKGGVLTPLLSWSSHTDARRDHA